MSAAMSLYGADLDLALTTHAECVSPLQLCGSQRMKDGFAGALPIRAELTAGWKWARENTGRAVVWRVGKFRVCFPDKNKWKCRSLLRVRYYDHDTAGPHGRIICTRYSVIPECFWTKRVRVDTHFHILRVVDCLVMMQLHFIFSSLFLQFEKHLPPNTVSIAKLNDDMPLHLIHTQVLLFREVATCKTAVNIYELMRWHTFWSLFQWLLQFISSRNACHWI